MKLSIPFSLLLLALTLYCTSLRGQLYNNTYFFSETDTVSMVDIKPALDNGVYMLQQRAKVTQFGELFSKELVLTRIDEAGDVLWTRKYGEGFYAPGGTLEVTADGGCLLGMVAIENFQTQSASLTKVDAQGEVMWSHRVNGTTSSIDLLAKERSDGTFIAVGSLQGAVPECFVMVFDSDGTPLWRRNYFVAFSLSAYISTMALTAEDELLLGGAFVLTTEQQATPDFLLRIAPDGTYLGGRLYQLNTGFSRGVGIYPLSNGDILTCSDVNLGENTITVFNISSGMLLRRLSPTGDLIWSRLLPLDESININTINGLTAYDISRSMGVVVDVNDVVSVYTDSDFGDTGQQRPVLFQLDGAGELLWSGNIFPEDYNNAYFYVGFGDGNLLMRTNAGQFIINWQSNEMLSRSNLTQLGTDLQLLCVDEVDLDLAPADITVSNINVNSMDVDDLVTANAMISTPINLTVAEAEALSSVPIVVDLGPDRNLCNGSVTLAPIDPSPGNYVWEDGSTNPSRVITSPGTYSVTYTQGECNPASDTIVVGENPVLNISVDGATTICPGGTFSLTASVDDPTANFQWLDEAGNFLASGPVAELTLFADQTLQLIASTDCATTDLVIPISAALVPLAELSTSETEVNLGESAQLNLQTNLDLMTSTIVWSPAAGLDCIDCPNPLATPFTTTNYEVTITQDNGCSASTAINLTVATGVPIFIPNIFSPNNDGSNDRFLVFPGAGVLQVDNIKVFDRWGSIVYDANSNEGWDGTFKGQPVNSGTYAYVVAVTLIDGRTQLLRGSVVLLR